MDNASPSTEQPDPGRPRRPSGPRVTRDEMKDLGRLRRSVTDRHVAGVAGGLARHLDVDPIIVRVALVVAVFFGGAGLLLYVAAWILVPEEGTDDEPLGLDQRSRTIALAGVGVLALVARARRLGRRLLVPVAAGDRRRARRVVPPPQGAATPAAGSAAPHRRRTTTSSCRTTPRPPPGYRDYATTYDPAYAPGDGLRRRPRPWGSYDRPRRPRNPRKRGPILFWFTLALIALAEGVLGVVDLAGVAVADSAYPALALGITALMLVVGSFWGRAGGLILAGPRRRARHGRRRPIGSNVADEDRYYAPTSAGEVQRGLRLRRRPLHPRPVRRLRRRRPRRPRRHHRRGRRRGRGGRPRRDGRRRQHPGRRRRQPGLRPAQRRLRHHARTGSSTAATTSRTCPSPSTWSAARSSSAKRPEEHCHD